MQVRQSQPAGLKEQAGCCSNCDSSLMIRFLRASGSSQDSQITEYLGENTICQPGNRLESCSLPSPLLFTHLRMRSSDSRRQMRHPKRIRSDFRVFVSRAERDLFLNERNIKRANRTNRDASRQLLPASFYHHIYAGVFSTSTYK